MDVQSIEGPQYFSRFDREVHFGPDLQINLLASVGLSLGEAPHVLSRSEMVSNLREHFGIR